MNTIIDAICEKLMGLKFNLIILAIGLFVQSCAIEKKIDSDNNYGYDEHYFEVSIKSVELINDSLFMNITFINKAKSIVFIPNEYIRFRLFFNDMEPLQHNLITSKVVYPVLKSKKNINETLCLSILDTNKYVVVHDTLNIKYNLTKMGYIYKEKILPKITGSISAGEELKNYCPYIFTGNKQLGRVPKGTKE